jgi:DNA repair exonuclease SbcCD ATPase subunit
MLKALRTKNFRKLTDNEFIFGDGLQVVRGSNEAGKTTMIEAITYALFGIKACREALDDVVTWGQPVSKLSVELELEIEGRLYTITRKKAGAEVNYVDAAGKPQKVVGQTEVGAFVERALGVSNATVSRLMLASQGAIRGALEAGPKATMELIEQLANFDVIDGVIEAITEGLPTGLPAPLEQKIEALTKQAEDMAASIVEPDQATYEAGVNERQTRQAQLEAELDADVTPLWKASKEDLDRREKTRQLAVWKTSELGKVRVARALHESQLAEAEKTAKTAPNPEEIADLERALAGSEAQQRLVNTFNAVAALKYPGQFWEGTKEEFEAELDRVTRAYDLYVGEMTKFTNDVRVLKAKRITDSVCGICEQDVSALPAVAAKNAAIDAEIAAFTYEAETCKASAAEANQTLLALRAVQTAAKPIERAIDLYGEYLEVQLDCYPPRYGWRGPAPQAPGNSAEMRDRLRVLTNQRALAAAAEGRITSLTATLTEDDATIARLEQEIAACGGEDGLDAAQKAFDEIDARRELLTNDIAEIRYLQTAAEATHKKALESYAVLRKAQENADTAVAQAKLELEELNFNNALLKAVRAARPVIADKLWAVVLTAVSTYFSTMRGTKSVVVREGNTFKVDGANYQGLSGSTLDILGLAIRLALTRTFLPTAPFLILDEPSAAMDEARTAAMLSFIVAAGFKQTILITHEEASEAVANNLITL